MSIANGRRTRSFTCEDPAAIAAVARQKPGLEYLREIVAGELPPPPVAQMLAPVRAGRRVAGRPREHRLRDPSLSAFHSTFAHASTGCVILR